ncbi:MAG: ATP-binding protein [Desulfovibrio sp.]
MKTTIHNFLNTLSFRSKINIGLFLIILINMMIIAPSVMHLVNEALLGESRKRGETIARELAHQASIPILIADQLSLSNIARRTTDNDSVVYAIILDNDGRVVAHTFSETFPEDLLKINVHNDSDFMEDPSILLLSDRGEKIYDIAVPIIISENFFGTARIGLSRSTIVQVIDELYITVGILSLSALGLALLLGSILVQYVTKKINKLRDDAIDMVNTSLKIPTSKNTKLNKNDLMCRYISTVVCQKFGSDNGSSQQLPFCRNCSVYRKQSIDEIQSLADTFNIMSYTLSNHIKALEKAQTEITGQKFLIQVILDALPIQVALYDTDLTYQQVNKSFAATYNMPEANFTGRTNRELFGNEKSEERRNRLLQVLETGNSLTYEELTTVEYNKVWTYTEMLPVLNKSKEFTGILEVKQDITELKQYHERLMQTQKLESLGKLAGGVAHEINTPLGVILGTSQILKDDLPADSDYLEDVEIIERNTQVCKRIVSDLLEFSRHNTALKNEVDIHDSLNKALELARNAFRISNIQFIMNLHPEKLKVYANSDQLAQVWINIFNNARDAIATTGAIAIQTSIQKRSTGDFVQIKISDTGTGIVQNNQEKVFDPFYTTKSIGQGTGLGLSLSFGIIKDHGGEIVLESPLSSDDINFFKTNSVISNSGTTFIIRIPLI